MKEGDKLDLVLTTGENGKPAVQVDDGPALELVKPVEEGKPLPQDAVLLKAIPCFGQPGRFHAEVAYAPEPPPDKPEMQRAGPARVSNTKYRSGWDQVFGDKSQLN